MKKLLKRLVAGMSAAAMLFLSSAVPDAWESDTTLHLTANAALGEAEDFLGTGTDASGVTIYNTNTKNSFNMNGRTCYQGIVFDDSKSNAQITFDVSAIDTLSFTVGHVDNTSSADATAKFYLDGEEYDSFSMHWTMNLMEYELDLSFADSLQIVIERSSESSYAFTDVTVDGIEAARPSKAPEYKSAEEFLESGYGAADIWLGNTSMKNPEIFMNGRGYYQGLVFSNVYTNSRVIYNVENIDSISFTVGHFDDKDTASATARIYLDDVEYDSISLYWNMNLLEYELDVSTAKTVKIVVERGGSHWTDYSSYAFANVTVDDYLPIKSYTIAEHDTVESFLNGGYAITDIWVANPENLTPEFYMNGRSYYQGLIFSDTYTNSQVIYNVEKIQSLSFTVGHLDDTGSANATVRFYLDNVEYDSIDLYWTMPLQEYALDVSGAKVLRIVVERGGSHWTDYSSYAFADMTIDKLEPKKIHTIPEYADGIEFAHSGFAVSKIWLPTVEAKEPEFYINEQGYYQGIVFSNDYENASVCYNVENLSSLSFTIGHVDDSDTANATLVFYLDNKKYDTISLTADMDSIQYTLNVTDYAVLRIVIERGGSHWTDYSTYALADITIESKDVEISPTESEILMGDCNNDGVFNLVDIITLQHWLLNDGTKLANWKAADLYEDEVIDVFDLVMLKRLLLSKT